MIKSDSAERLNIISPGGIELQIARIHVRSIRPASVSMMPMGLDATLSDQQLLDLVAWMGSLQ
jgi:putative heme-binding domain-containing protein